MDYMRCAKRRGYNLGKFSVEQNKILSGWFTSSKHPDNMPYTILSIIKGLPLLPRLRMLEVLHSKKLNNGRVTMQSVINVSNGFIQFDTGMKEMLVNAVFAEGILSLNLRGLSTPSNLKIAMSCVSTSDAPSLKDFKNTASALLKV